MELSIDIDQTLGIVDPKLHGQFIEFLGECIDQGIWVGPDSKIPNIHGFRKTIVRKDAGAAPSSDSLARRLLCRLISLAGWHWSTQAAADHL